MAGFMGPGPAQAAGKVAGAIPKFNPAISNFLKGNAKFAFGGAVGLGFLGLSVADIVNSDNKLKALLKGLKDFLLIRVALVGTFTAFGAAIRALAKDTGSLDAALKRLGEVQRLTRVFTPLVGGAKAARQHVAELVNFADKTPFTFEGVAEADKNLRSLTKGAFSGIGALKVVGDAAAASGNGFEQSAAAIGGFYEALNSGQPINQANEQLRQMGLITDISAKHLQSLSDAGDSSISMANNLTRALEESRGGMASYANDLQGISAAHEKAAEAAKAAFGKGFTIPNIRDVKNSTAILIALAPALEDIGKVLAAVTNGMGALTGKIVKAAAESGVLGTVIKGLVAVVLLAVGAFTIMGVIAIPGFIAAVIAATASLGAFGVALGFATGGLAIITAAIALLLVGGGLYGLWKLTKENTKALKELNQAHREAQASINAHAAAIKDLIDLQQAYGLSIENLIKLQNELDEAIKKGDWAKVAEIKRAIQEARLEMLKLPKGSTLGSPERGAVIESRMKERMMREEAQFREQVAQHPERAPELQRQRAELLEQRAAQGQAGLQARQRVAEKSSDSLQHEAQLKIEKAEIERRGKGGKPTGLLDQTNYRMINSELAEIEDKTLKIKETEGKGTAVELEAQASRMEHAQAAKVATATARGASTKEARQAAKDLADQERRMAGGAEADPRRAQALRKQAEEMAEREKQTPEMLERARELRGERIAGGRQREISKVELGTETIQAQARLTGDTMAAERAEDVGAFVQSFEKFRQQGFEEPQAKAMALQERQNQLLEQQPLDIKPVVSSLQKIGGGGGGYGPTGDPAKRVQERIRDLMSTSNDILKQIEENTAQYGTTAPGGGAEGPAAGELPPGAPGSPEEPIPGPATGQVKMLSDEEGAALLRGGAKPVTAEELKGGEAPIPELPPQKVTPPMGPHKAPASRPPLSLGPGWGSVDVGNLSGAAQQVGMDLSAASSGNNMVAQSGDASLRVLKQIWKTNEQQVELQGVISQKGEGVA